MAAHNFKDLVGQVFGRLTVIERAENYHRKFSRYLCRCECGRTLTVPGGHLRTSHTRSCGCIVNRRGTFGLSKKISEYNIWAFMIQRCLNPANPAFADYGGRGITVCERWRESLANFLSDMGPRPGPRYSIDRLDNNGPYAPENCRWATRIEQNNNTRTNRMLSFNGKTQTMAQWARELGIQKTTLHARFNLYGWSVERALTTPVRH